MNTTLTLLIEIAEFYRRQANRDRRLERINRWRLAQGRPAH